VGRDIVEVDTPVRRLAPAIAAGAGASGLRRSVWALIAVAVVCLAGAAHAQAATYTVAASSADTTPGMPCELTSGTCSLREAIERSATDDTINVPAGTYTLINGALDVSHALTIVGAGARATVISSSGCDCPDERVFTIESGTMNDPVIIFGVTIEGGSAQTGNGGDVLNAGDVSLIQDEIVNSGPNNLDGGGIANEGGILGVSQSLVSGNQATSTGGGIANDSGSLTVFASTIADNTAPNGGGISTSPEAVITEIVDSTIAHNTGSPGGLQGGGATTVFSSIVADNAGANGGPPDCSGAQISSQQYNLESGTDCGFTATGDHQNSDPQFTSSAPQANGGPTDTLALAPSNVAVDAVPIGAPGCAGLDQAGTARPQGPACDIGAYELPKADPTVTVAPATFSAGAGSAYTGPVATFSYSASGTPASSFSATIAWGDGATSPGTVNTFGSGYSVNGSHSYSVAGSYTVTVTVTDALGNSATGASVATVSDAPKLVSAKPVVQGTSSASLSGTVNPEGAATQAYYQYGLDLRYTRVGASGPNYTATTSSQNLTGDFSAHQVLGALGGLLPNALYHVRLVATNATGTTDGPDQTFTTKADPPPPPPVLGQSVNLKPVSGLVFIHIPSSHGSHSVFRTAAAKAPTTSSGFVPLTQARQLPAGTEVDAVQGALALTAATAKRKKSQTGTFSGAVFKLSQLRLGPQKGQETLSLVEGAYKGGPSFAACKAKTAHTALAGPIAGEAKLSPKILQTLHARDNHGSFRTRGKLAAGTVRGTVWDTSERCDGTYTVVHQGTVDVFVYALHKTIAVHAGHHYLAMYGKQHP
jgi:hypothetical protein